MSGIIELRSRRTNVRLLIEDFDAPIELHPIIDYAQEPLLSLIDACKPLDGIVYNIINYVAVALRDSPNDPADGLTRDESAAIRLYTFEWTGSEESLYSILNKTLSRADRKHLRPWFKYLKLFLTALVKIPCTSAKTIWRGVRKNIRDQVLHRAQVTWWNFSSCSRTLSVLENDMYLGTTGERTLLSIEAFNGRDISGHSHFQNEEEILLLPGTYMEVQSYSNLGSNLDIIHLKQIEPNEMLLEPPFEGACLYPRNEKVSGRRRLWRFLTGLFITSSSSRHWYRKKRFTISICLLTIMCVVAIIVGSVLGLKFTDNKTVIKTNIMPNATTIVGSSGGTCGVSSNTGLIPLYLPGGLYQSSNGILYVADNNPNLTIIAYALNNNTSHVFMSWDTTNGPIHIFVDNRTSNIYISILPLNTVEIWPSDVTYPGTSNGRCTLNTLFQPTYVTVDSHSNVYIASWACNWVTKWSPAGTSGTLIVGSSSGGYGNDSQSLHAPYGLFLDEVNSLLYVSDRLNHRIQKVVLGYNIGTTIAGGNGAGPASNQLNQPTAVFVSRFDGSLYICDTNNNRIQKWAKGASFGITIAGSPNAISGTAPNLLSKPYDVWINPDETYILVVDANNCRVQKFLLQ